MRLRCLFGWRDREGEKCLFFVFFCFAEFVGERRSAQVGAGGLSGSAGWHRGAQGCAAERLVRSLGVAWIPFGARRNQWEGFNGVSMTPGPNDPATQEPNVSTSPIDNPITQRVDQPNRQPKAT